MKSNFLKHYFPHIIAIIVFASISIIYCSPTLKGKRLAASDYKTNIVESKTSSNHKNETGNMPLWDNDVFSGMPSYLIDSPRQQNIFYKIYTLFFIKGIIPVSIIFWYLLGFYILLNIFKINPWISIFGSLAFAFSSYLFIILIDGHFEKAMSIGFMAPIIGGVYLAFERKKIWIGMFLMAFFLSMQMVTTSFQVVGYTGFIVLFYLIFEFISAIIHRNVSTYTKTLGILIIGIILALGINSAHILTVREYIPYSIHGKSELSTIVEGNTQGYSDFYSQDSGYDIDEIITFLIPNAKGGASYSKLNESSNTYSVLERYYGKKNAQHAIMSVPLYFGNRSNNSGPVYIGAFIVFLFIFSLFVVRGKIKWWLVSLTVFSILLAWFYDLNLIKNPISGFLLEYSGFDAKTLVLIIAEFSIPFLAVLGLAEVLNRKIEKKNLINYFYISLGITGIFTMLFIIAPTISGLDARSDDEIEWVNSYLSGIPDDPDYDEVKDELKNSLIHAIYKDKFSMVRGDAFRSLVFIILGAFVFYLIIQNKLKPNIAIIVLSSILLIDMWSVNKRYLNNDDFVFKSFLPYEKTIADESILKNNNSYYRVCNISGNIFNDKSTSFYHKSIGGYIDSKILRYQELCDSIMLNEIYLSRYLTMTGDRSGFDAEEIQDLYNKQAKTPILNMLNSKYLIFRTDKPAVINHNALGNAWFVDENIFVDNPDQELKSLKNINTATTVVISKQFQRYLEGFKFKNDSLASIKLTDMGTDFAIYETNTSSEQLAVFSEIYYPKGWKVTIDNNEADHFRVNYVLRAMRIPQGKHIIKFYFEPHSYKTGVYISYICSIILLLLIVGGIIVIYQRKKKLDNI